MANDHMLQPFQKQSKQYKGESSNTAGNSAQKLEDKTNILQNSIGNHRVSQMVKPPDGNHNEGIQRTIQLVQAIVANESKEGGKGIVQGIWGTDTTTGKKINLRVLKGETSKTGKQLYYHGATKTTYEEVTSKPLTVQETDDAKTYYPTLQDLYSEWEVKHETVTAITPFGPVTVRHSRCAPYIQSKKGDYEDYDVDVDYSNIIANLKTLKVAEKHIAQDLLDGTTHVINKNPAFRAAAHLVAIVYLAERWRKQGAEKIFRGILRGIIGGDMSLDDIEDVFKFVESANAGRKQIKDFKEVYEGAMDVDDMDDQQQIIHENLSDVEDDDYMSEDEMRDEKNSENKSRQKYL